MFNIKPQPAGRKLLTPSTMGVGVFLAMQVNQTQASTRKSAILMVDSGVACPYSTRSAGPPSRMPCGEDAVEVVGHA